MEESFDDVAPVGIIDSSIINEGTPSPKINNTIPTQNDNNYFSLLKEINDQEKEIKELKNENNQLKNQLNQVFQNIISLNNKMNQLNKLDNCFNKINQFDLNFLYNRLDNELYKLEDSYKSLNHDIIKNRAEFGLINSGIKNILNSNISKCLLKYKSSVDGKNTEIFHSKCDNIFYQLYIIKTTNEKRFGVFFCGKQKINNNSEDINLYSSYNSYNSNNNFFSSMNSFENFINDNLSIDFINNNKNEIFNCKTFPEKFFVFSLNKGKIYYPRLKNATKSPCFSIFFDPYRESYYGKEKKININAQIRDYVLSGKEEFNILEFEVYEIEIKKIN